MMEETQAEPRLRVIIHRDRDLRWRWYIHGKKTRMLSERWVRIESCVANLEQMLGVKAEWSYTNQRVRTLTLVGRPVDVEIRR